jgi:hypothetical protein
MHARGKNGHFGPPCDLTTKTRMARSQSRDDEKNMPLITDLHRTHRCGRWPSDRLPFVSMESGPSRRVICNPLRLGRQRAVAAPSARCVDQLASARAPLGGCLSRTVCMPAAKLRDICVDRWIRSPLMTYVCRLSLRRGAPRSRQEDQAALPLPRRGTLSANDS